MEANIINIGNSKGIIIPAKFLKIFGFESVVNVEVDQGKLIISPATKPRADWDKIIENEVKNNGQPNQLIPDFLDDESNNDWQW